MKDSKALWVWVGVVVVVAAIAAWFIWKPTPAKAPTPSGPVPAYASQGQLTPQFPKDLIIDGNASISGSYSISYSSSTNQYTAVYDSSSTVTALFNQYKTYLTQNGWNISGSLTSHPTFDLLSAGQGNDQLQVVISTNGKGSEATVTYLVK